MLIGKQPKKFYNASANDIIEALNEFAKVGDDIEIDFYYPGEGFEEYKIELQ